MIRISITFSLPKAGNKLTKGVSLFNLSGHTSSHIQTIHVSLFILDYYES